MKSEKQIETFLRDVYPLTSAESAMYQERQLNPDSVSYNINVGIFISGAEEGAIREAMAQILSSHDAFRSAYDLRDGVPSRVLLSEVPKIKTGEPMSRESFDALLAEPGAPFDFKAGVPLRLALYPLKEGGFGLHLQIHHIAFDGGSLSPLMRELNRRLRGDVLPATGPDLHTISADSGNDAALLSEGLAFYRELFQDGIPSCDMPTKGPRPNRQPSTDTILRRRICPEEVSALTACARRYGVSVFETILSVTAATLGKYCAMEDVVLGIPVDTRDSASKDIIGMFVNTVPVRIRPERALPLSDYFTATAAVMRQASRNSRIPFGTLVDEFCRGWSEGRNPVFDMAVNYYHEPESLKEGGIETDSYLYPQQVPWDLCLNIRRRTEGMEVLLQYASELYDNLVMENFFEQFLEGLKRISHSELTFVDDLMALPEGHLEQLKRFDQTAVPREDCDVVTLFRRQAAKTPDNDALIYRDHRYTYAQVDEISERIAAHLKENDIGSEAVVSILIPRCEYMVLAALGVLKSGAAYQPLDPGYPSERLEFMVADAGAKFLIADRTLLDRIPCYTGRVLCLDEIPALPVAREKGKAPRPENAFILLYTSGSTGTPKGVVLEHRNLSNFCGWYRDFFSLTPDSRVAAYASFGFDACMMDLYPALTSGAAVVIIPEEIRLDFAAIQHCFEENHVTHSFMTTQVGRQFADFYSGSTLKHLFVGGETLAPIETKGKRFSFYNVYGPTECTILTTVFSVDRLYPRVPIGKPLDNVRLYVVDEAGRLLPPGVPGELWIAGFGVGRGYLNRPEQTAQVFIDNPFTKESGYERIYRTGDVVRRRPEGNIDFLGRNDGQVKIRGFRIELTEVEGVIREFPQVTDATVQAFDGPSGGKFLAAYLVSDVQIDMEALRRFIAERKPSYMVPESIIQIERIPLNRNQKVNKSALPKPETGQNTKEKEERPLTPFEEELMAVIRGILGDIAISPTASLARYGLTSIGSIHLIADIYKLYRVEISPAKLKEMSLVDLENEIINALIRMVKEGDGRPSIEKTDRFEPYPLSAAQLGVYMEIMKKPDSKVYNIPVWFEFGGEVSVDKLKDAISGIVKAHPSLNVHFETIDGQVMAVKNDEAEPVIHVTDMTTEQFEASKADRLASFHPSKGPLYAFTIIRCDSSIWLYADFHHLIFDGYSLDLFVKELKNALSGGEPEWEETDYSVFVKEQQAFLSSEEVNAFDEYFSNLFEKYESPTRITPDRPRSDYPGMAKTVRIPLDQEEVEEAVRRTGVREAAFFLSVFYYVAARLTNSDDVYISTISSGRGDVRFAETFGMFVNTLPLASSLSSGTVDEFIKKDCSGA